MSYGKKVFRSRNRVKTYGCGLWEKRVGGGGIGVGVGEGERTVCFTLLIFRRRVQDTYWLDSYNFVKGTSLLRWKRSKIKTEFLKLSFVSDA